MTAFDRLASLGLAAALGGLLALGPPGPALAIGGSSADEAASRFLSRTVMVLGSRGSVCTGTVLTPSVVITAGHCVAGSREYAVAYKDGGSPTLQAVRSVSLHPQFSRKASVSVDMALVRLETPLPSRFSPVAVDDADREHAVGQTKMIAGFGLARDGDDASAGTLRQASVTVLPRYYPRFLRLGVQDGSLAICKGDSGGPVFTDGFTGPVLVGVIYAAERNGGRQCGATAQAVRIAPQRAWIDGVLARWGER
jgi:secreted trypsin-like serine protease